MTQPSGSEARSQERAVDDVVAPDLSAPPALRLGADFPTADRERWRELIATVLGKSGRTDLPAPVEDALRSSIQGGLEINALYETSDAADRVREIGVPGSPPFIRGTQAGHGPLDGWDVRARHAHPDPRVTREAIAADLDNGVTSLWLVLGPGAIPVESVSDVLSDVLLDVAPVVLQAGSASRSAADSFFALARASGVGTDALLGSLGVDPFGEAIRTGVSPDLSVSVELTRRCQDEFPQVRPIVVDGTAVHDAGAGIVEELAYSLAAGVAHLRALTEAGVGVDSAFGSLDFRYSAGADQFLTIAGLRAARRLWNRVGEVSGAAPGVRGQRQHAVTSSVMMTRRDPWVNLLRTTVACFAAGVGGANAVTVAPFDSALGRPDAFGRRIARNTQALLMQEGHLARVLDPAGGSAYVESLTEQVAVAAWARFTEIERAGGLAAAMAEGLLAERITADWAQRRERLAHRREPIIGVNEFPNLSETLPVREPDRLPTDPVSTDSGWPVVRAAQDFEALRDRADAAVGQRGRRPAVFLAAIGTTAATTRRASFAANLFQAAGLETPSNGADDGDDAAIVSAFTDSGTTVACLCGADEAYAERAADLTGSLARAGASQLWITGEPNVTGDVAGIDGHVFPGCDAVAVLGRTMNGLGLDGPEGGGDA